MEKFIIIDNNQNLILNIVDPYKLSDSVTYFEDLQNMTEYTKDLFSYYLIEDTDIPLDPELLLGRYLYTPVKGFFINENYKKPNEYGVSDTLLEQIKADYREQLAKEVSEYGYNA